MKIQTNPFLAIYFLLGRRYTIIQLAEVIKSNNFENCFVPKEALTLDKDNAYHC
jgi:hypothetical protein